MHILIVVFAIGFVLFRAVMKNAQQRAALAEASRAEPLSRNAMPPRTAASRHEVEARFEAPPVRPPSYELQPLAPVEETFTISPAARPRSYPLSASRRDRKMAATMAMMAGPGICTPRGP